MKPDESNWDIDWSDAREYLEPKKLTEADKDRIRARFAREYTIPAPTSMRVLRAIGSYLGEVGYGLFRGLTCRSCRGGSLCSRHAR